MRVEFTSTTDLLAVAGDQPYVRAWLRHPQKDFRGWHADGATVWAARLDGREGLQVRALGEPTAAVLLLREVVPALPAEIVLSLPRPAAPLVGRVLRFRVRNQWEFRWTIRQPPEVSGEDAVHVLPDSAAGEVTDLLDGHSPGAEVRPGSSVPRRWVGIREGSGRLVAAAADTSGPNVGHISSVVTASDRRGQGLATALTTGLTRRLLAEFGLCTLGLYDDNEVARRVYVRVGYDGALPLSSGPAKRLA